MSDLLLQTDRLTKSYSGVTVLDCASLKVRVGEVHALLGANGAGKSTLSRIIAGLVSASSGSMQFQGKPFLPKSKRDAEKAGVEIVQQEFNLLPTLSIAENLFLRELPNRFGIVQKHKLVQSARELLEFFGLALLDPSQLLSSLGVGQQQMIEIAAAFARSCRLLILDEPTAALSQRESDLLFEQIQRLKSQGNSILYISHRLDEVLQICDRLTIMRDGKIVKSADVAQVDKEEIIRWMSGSESISTTGSPATPPSTGSKASIRSNDAANDPTSTSANTPLLRVEKLCSGQVQDVSFEVKPGERLGITGLVGSGRTRLLNAIFGAAPIQSGSVYLAGKTEKCRFRGPSDAVAAGIALVTEDRKQNGLLLPLPISANSTLASLRTKFSAWGRILFRAESQGTAGICDRLAIKRNSINQSVGTLSGGNQQKVVLAKWLLRDSTVFLFDEPTRGIDVAARRLVHDLIAELSAMGKAIVVVSSDLDELFETCDRISVMSRGRMVAHFTRDQLNHDQRNRDQSSRELITRASFADIAE
ncbi:MAG: sugar ABC transporter ATP-binding protein [Pirellulales bacterium]